MPVQIPRRSPWTNQRLVIGALLRREAVTRFGQYKMGVLWMLTEPLIGVLVIGLLLGPLVGRTAPDMPYAFFLLNGFVLMQTFTGPMTSGMGAIGSNMGLLVFPKVQPLDLLLARFIFELGTSIMSFILFCLVGMWVGIKLSMGYLHILLAAFIITWLVGSGLGLILGVGAAHYQSVEKIVAFIKRPLIFVSCVLYPLYNLPNIAQKILLWNPLVHTIELSRKSLFPLYHITPDVNLAYPASVAIVIFSVGICFFHNNRHFLTQR
jgi:capsular polysaccharide transport system permease protein